MKKLFTILAISLMLPFAMILTACGGGTPPNDPGDDDKGEGLHLSIETNDDVWFTRANANSFIEQYMPEDGNELAVWIADYFDKDTLVVKLDGQPITLTEEPLFDYENRVIGYTPQKIATFSLSSELTGAHTITYTVEEVELSVKFVSNGQTFSEDERAVMSAYSFADGTDFESALDNSSYQITTTYSQLVGMNGLEGNIPYTSDKPYGYYSSPAVIKTVDNDTWSGCSYIGGTDYNKYSFEVRPMGDGFASREIELTFNKDFLNEAALSIGGENKEAKIFSYNIGGTPIDLELTAWKSSETEDKSVRVYLEPYAGVDFANVEVYIFEEQMEVFTDPQNSKKYFTIPAGKLPVHYHAGSDEFNIREYSTYYYVILKNIDFTASNLFNQLNVTTNASGVEIGGFVTRYCYCDGQYYYEPGVTQVVFWVINNGATPLKIKVNSTEFSLTNYNYYNSSLPLAEAGNNVTEDADAYRTSNGSHFYKVEIDATPVFLVVDFNNERNAVTQIDLHIAVSGNTTIQLVF